MSDRISQFVPIILAGGHGSRLWPISNRSLPKQFLGFEDSTKSFYQMTLDRALSLAEAGNILTVTSADLAQDIIDQIELGLYEFTPNNLILEPAPRNTAAAVIMASLYVRDHFGDSIVWIMPSDHVIQNADKLKSTIHNAVNEITKDDIIAFGIKPDHPSSNFGYMVCNDKRKVNRFVEKPEGKILEEIYSSDSYWNSGMYMAYASTLINETKLYARDFYDHINRAYQNSSFIDGKLNIRHEDYFDIYPTPIDKLLMEKTSRLKLIPLESGWSDIGNIKALWEAGEKNGELSISCDGSDKDIDKFNQANDDFSIERVDGRLLLKRLQAL